MTKANRSAIGGAVGIGMLSLLANAAPGELGMSMGEPVLRDVPFYEVHAKAALAQTLGARATVTPAATAYGGFEMRASAMVYVMVRGNSLGTLGITQHFLDNPRVRVFNALGQDLAFDISGNAGFNGCGLHSASAAAVYNYYVQVRGETPRDRDACLSGTLPAGTYTFAVVPSVPGVTTVSSSSVPSSGEILFEVILNP